MISRALHNHFGSAPVNAVLMVLLLLTGCAGATSRPWDADWNPQQYAGLTVAEIKWCQDGAGQTWPDVKWFDGKQKQFVELTVDPAAKKFTYTAKGVEVFPAFKARKDAENWVATQFKEATSDLRGSLVDIITKLQGLP